MTYLREHHIYNIIRTILLYYSSYSVNTMFKKVLHYIAPKQNVLATQDGN